MFRKSVRLIFLAAMLLIAYQPALYAQPESEKQLRSEAGENEKPDLKWHLVNTALFAIGLGWAIWKLAPSFFNARSADIQRAIQEATGLKMQADLRYSEIDRKMATLPDEVKRMKQESDFEMNREHRRRQEETAREVRRIQDSSAAEVEALRQEAIRLARRRTAQSALQLAEERLAARVPASSNDELLQDFIHLVERGKN